MVAIVYPGFTADEPTVAGRALVTAGDAMAQRSLLGLGFTVADDATVVHRSGDEMTGTLYLPRLQASGGAPLDVTRNGVHAISLSAAGFVSWNGYGLGLTRGDATVDAYLYPVNVGAVGIYQTDGTTLGEMVANDVSTTNLRLADTTGFLHFRGKLTPGAWTMGRVGGSVEFSIAGGSVRVRNPYTPASFVDIYDSAVGFRNDTWLSRYATGPAMQVQAVGGLRVRNAADTADAPITAGTAIFSSDITSGTALYTNTAQVRVGIGVPPSSALSIAGDQLILFQSAGLIQNLSSIQSSAAGAAAFTLLSANVRLGGDVTGGRLQVVGTPDSLVPFAIQQGAGGASKLVTIRDSAAAEVFSLMSTGSAAFSGAVQATGFNLDSGSTQTNLTKDGRAAWLAASNGLGLYVDGWGQYARFELWNGPLDIHATNGLNVKGSYGSGWGPITAGAATFTTNAGYPNLTLVSSGEAALRFDSALAGAHVWGISHSAGSLYFQHATTRPFGGTIISPLIIGPTGDATFSGQIGLNGYAKLGGISAGVAGLYANDGTTLGTMRVNRLDFESGCIRWNGGYPELYSGASGLTLVTNHQSMVMGQSYWTFNSGGRAVIDLRNDYATAAVTIKGGVGQTYHTQFTNNSDAVIASISPTGAATFGGDVILTGAATGFRLNPSGVSQGLIYWDSSENRLYSTNAHPWVVMSDAGFKVRNQANTADAPLIAGAATFSGPINGASFGSTTIGGTYGSILLKGGVSVHNNVGGMSATWFNYNETGQNYIRGSSNAIEGPTTFSNTATFNSAVTGKTATFTCDDYNANTFLKIKTLTNNPSTTVGAGIEFGSLYGTVASIGFNNSGLFDIYAPLSRLYLYYDVTVVGYPGYGLLVYGDTGVKVRNRDNTANGPIMAGAATFNSVQVGVGGLGVPFDIQGGSSSTYSAVGLGLNDSTGVIYNLNSTAGTYSQLVLVNRGSAAGYVRLAAVSNGISSSELVVSGSANVELLRIANSGAATFSGTISSPTGGTLTGERFGAGSVSSDYGIALGQSATGAAASVACGYATNTIYESVAVGSSAYGGWRGVAIGRNASTSNHWSYGSVAIGYGATTTHDAVVALGSNVISTMANQFVTGAASSPITNFRIHGNAATITFERDGGSVMSWDASLNTTFSGAAKVNKTSFVANSAYVSCQQAGVEEAALQTGIIAGYGGTLKLSAGGTDYILLRANAGYPRLDINGTFGIYASSCSMVLGGTYLSWTHTSNEWLRHDGQLRLRGDLTQSYDALVTNASARLRMLATGQRASEVGDGAGAWQTGYREEYNASGIRCGFYNATPIARQEIDSGSATLAADLLAALTNLGLVQTL